MRSENRTMNDGHDGWEARKDLPLPPSDAMLDARWLLSHIRDMDGIPTPVRAQLQRLAAKLLAIPTVGDVGARPAGGPSGLVCACVGVLCPDCANLVPTCFNCGEDATTHEHGADYCGTCVPEPSFPDDDDQAGTFGHCRGDADGNL